MITISTSKTMAFWCYSLFIGRITLSYLKNKKKLKKEKKRNTDAPVRVARTHPNITRH